MKSRKSDLEMLPYLRTRLSYNAESGEFTWIKHRLNMMLGATAGGLHSHGYIRIRVDGVSYFAHRLAFMFVNGRIPCGEIDHINHDRDDNRICNLRESTISENRSNVKPKKKKAGKLKGCYLNGSGSWVAEIRKNKKKYHLGSYPTEEEAHAAYCHAAKTLHGEFSCTS